MHVPASVLPPPDAYRYWPQGEFVFYGAQKNIVRLIFYKTQFTAVETQELQLFKAQLSSFINPSYFLHLPDAEILRVLLGCKFNFKQAAQGLVASYRWKTEVVPESYLSLWGRVQGVLETGAIYVHGRDHRFRPILIVNLERLDLKRHSVEEYRNLLCFTLEFILSHMLLLGQIENWVVLTDLCKIGLSSIPRSVRLK
jgi:hypothetical protein